MRGGPRLRQTVLGGKGNEDPTPHRPGGRKRATRLHGPTSSDDEGSKRTKDERKRATPSRKTPRRPKKEEEFSFQMHAAVMETPKLPKKTDIESDSDMKMATSEDSDTPSNMSTSSEESMETIGSVSIQADGSVKRISEARPKQSKKKTRASGRKASDVMAAAYANFNPLAVATWKQGEKVPYKFLAESFEAIEATSKRLEITQHLTECFRCILATTPEDLRPAIYLCINKVAPAHEGLELGIGDSILMKAIANVSGGGDVARIRKQYDEDGDLGSVAVSRKKGQIRLVAFDNLSIADVFKKFLDIAKDAGDKSQERKRGMIERLLNASRDSEAKYITRSLQGKMRIGLAEQTVLQSIGQAFFMHLRNSRNQNKLLKRMEVAVDRVKQAYSICPSYDKLIACMLEHGFDGLAEYVSFTPGIPVQPMLAKPTSGISEVLEKFTNIPFTCEFKYDGERSQIHVLENNTVLIYSRNSENVTGKYPDIVQQIPQYLKPGVTSVVLDCETVAFDAASQKILPFQKLSTRARKDVSLESIKVPVCVFCFDCLFLNGEPLVEKPLTERREALYSAINTQQGVIQFAEHRMSTDVEELQTFLDLSVDSSTEGLIVKTLDCSYEPAKRSINWLKLKKDYLEGVGDSFDLVVIGAWNGKGKRTGVFGSYLLAVYDPVNDEYQSITKIGTGFSDEDLETFTSDLEALKIPGPLPNYSFGDAITPDVWFRAQTVWEVRAADLSISPVHMAAFGILDKSKGISIRFPRLMRVRNDKSATDATTSEQVTEMYKSQGIVPETSKAS